MIKSTKHKRTREEVREDNAIRLQAKKEKQNTYFTGRPCRNNHIDARYVKNDLCVQCVKENNVRREEKQQIKKREESGLSHYMAVEYVKRDALRKALVPLVMHHMSMEEIQAMQSWVDKKTALTAK